MRRGIARCIVTVLVVWVGSILSAAAGQQDEASSDVQVDGAVQVTADPDPARGHLIPALAVDPSDDRVLAIAEGDAVGGACAVHVSVDRGLTWRQASTPEVPARWDRCAFQNLGTLADVAFAPDGSLYYAFNGYDSETYEGQVFLARSHDLGETWETSALPRVARDVDDGEFGLDALPSIAVDPNDADHVHVAWNSNWGTWTLREEVRQGLEYYWDIVIRPYVASSTDGGQSFSEPVNLAEDLWLEEGNEGVKTPPHALAGTDGTVYVVFGEESWAGPRDDPGDDAPPASIYLAVSRDGGGTYESSSIYTEPAPDGTSYAWIWPARGAVDHRSGNLYVVWEQLSNAGQPVSISMIRSTDGGRTWSDPTAVNDVEQRRSTGMELFPDVSVAPNGRVDVAWYDSRNDPTVDLEAADGGSQFHDVYYSYSDDEGRTWSRNERITDRIIDRRIGPFDVGDIQGTLGVASSDQGAYIAWDDTRNGSEETQSQDIYFARARLTAPSSFFSAGGEPPSSHRLLWGALGAAVALMAGGVALLLTVRGMARGARDPGRLRGAAARSR